jgi:hypothetical protein
MQEKEIQKWKREREIAKRYMAPKHRVWRRLLKAYRMEYEHLGVDEVVRISRFYPLTRQLLASISFRYPHIMASVDNPVVRDHAEIIASTANAANRVMDVRPEVQQALFDALYCYLGWLKFDYNPAGNNDIIAPYVTSDTMANDMVSVRRVSPFNVYIDPLTPPHKLHEARYIMEDMIVPLEFVRKDPRFDRFKNKIKPIVREDRDEMLNNLQESPMTQDEREAYTEAQENGEMVMLTEVHDRIHGKRVTFARGIDEPVEEIDHPFLEMDAITIPDPITGEPLMTGEMVPTGAWLVKGGFPYHPIQFDLHDGTDGPMGLPMMGYVEDQQKIQVESISRRADLLKRYPRLLLGQKSERDENEVVAEQIEDAKDGTILWVNDVNNAFREMQMGNVPQDQLLIDRSAKEEEESILNVSGVALAGSGKMTATQSSLVASFGQLNREWLQDSVSQAYETIAHNTLRIMSDPRYTPEEFIVEVSVGDQRYQQVIESDILKVPFRINIEANSMRPLFEQMEREDTLALVNTLANRPEVNQMELIKMVLRTFKVSDPDKLIGQGERATSVRKAQLENQFMAARLQDPGVLPTDDHQAELQAHQQAQQDPAVTQFLQQAMQVNPQAVQQFQQIMQVHMQQHQQFLQQGARAGGGTAKAVPSVNDINGQVQAIESTVRSNAQRVSQAVSAADPDQN